MAAEKKSTQTIDEYIAGFPPDVRARLESIRAVILEVAPDSVEAIKYGIPTFVYEGNLVHFGAFKHHIGFYPAPSGLEKFKSKLAQFKSSKGAVRFPNDQPLPLDLVREITAFRLQENQVRAAYPGKT
jgi:uncharacterized protein YdhG (YjbR/CyaY superfamily)